MSDKEMNSYRFSSGQEPTDEMLSRIMKEVAEEAENDRIRTTEEHFNAMLLDIKAKRSKWAEKINRVTDGKNRS